MGLLRLLSSISFALGAARTLVRRLAGLALIAMGVHAAADVLDDLAYDALDALDLVVDNGVAAFLAWLASAGGMTTEGAVHAIEGFAGFVDLAEKDWLALRLALVAEVALDIVLLDLAWGSRAKAGASVLEDLRRSTQELREVARAIDAERLLAPLTLLAFAVGGAVVVGLAIEQPIRAALAALAPGLVVASNLAAFAALVVTSVLIWRFVPDMLQGALVRAHERGVALKERQRRKREAHPPRAPRLIAVVDFVRRGLRGAWLVVALGVAVAGVVGGTEVKAGQGARGLADRLGAMP